MMNLKEIQDDVKRFVSDFQRVPIEDISLDTSLKGDLGIDGDDADEFMVEFREHFDVDFSEFDLNEHFGPEGCAPWMLPYDIALFLMRLVTPQKYHVKLGGFEPVTILDLVETVVAGSWHDRKQGHDKNEPAQPLED